MTAPYCLVVDSEKNIFRVTGELSFATANDLLDEAASLFKNHHKLHIDFTGVNRSDSAGLAVLIDWVRLAKTTSKEIIFYNVPTQLLAIANASGVDTFLPIHKP